MNAEYEIKNNRYKEAVIAHINNVISGVNKLYVADPVGECAWKLYHQETDRYQGLLYYNCGDWCFKGADLSKDKLFSLLEKSGRYLF